MAQFSTATEASYLNHINKQKRQDLIKDNIPNAEICFAHSLSQINQGPNTTTSIFLYELSQSYDINNEHQLALHRLLVQRCLFPQDSISALSYSVFYNLSYKNNFSKSFASYLWISSSSSELMHNADKNLILLIKLSTQLHLKKLQPYIYQLGDQLRIMDADIPRWYSNWAYLVRIGVQEKHLKLLINYENNSGKALNIASINDKRLRKKIYRKSIKYYLKNNAFVHSKELMLAYKKEDQNWLESMDLSIKKTRGWLHW
ncbi:MAG: hypothetical protein B7C24_08580 [Bacteroidetes bacterium 4572_77]|nr:MAG: hypothetical protein B7C24_08580 [Bacteroidetes bacterium 4572_77]